MPTRDYVAHKDLVLIQGSTFRRAIRWGIGTQDDAGTWTLNEVIDLTGYSAAMQIRKGYRTGEGVLLELTSDVGGGITLGGIEGTIDLLVTDEQTDSLDFDIARYDLELYSPAGDTKRLLQGRVGLSHEITREESS